MNPYHFDANPIVDLLRGKRPRVQERFDALAGNEVGVSLIVVGELRLGVEKSGNAEEERKVRKFLAKFAKVGLDEDIAREYARIRAYLEVMGQKMDSNDLWIAATALRHGANLVTADEAFRRVPGLRVEDWRV